MKLTIGMTGVVTANPDKARVQQYPSGFPVEIVSVVTDHRLIVRSLEYAVELEISVSDFVPRMFVKGE